VKQGQWQRDLFAQTLTAGQRAHVIIIVKYDSSSFYFLCVCVVQVQKTCFKVKGRTEAALFASSQMSVLPLYKAGEENCSPFDFYGIPLKDQVELSNIKAIVTRSYDGDIRQ
jgi:hypothetical protein